MRINLNSIQRFRLRNFYNLFRDLYGEILTDAEINHLLENNEFIVVGFVPNLLIYHEVDLPSQDIANYFIAIKENETYKPRFIIRWERVPLTTGETTDKIGEIELIEQIDTSELFCESHNFAIGTVDGNQIDSEFLILVVTANDEKERVKYLIQHLQEIIKQNDPRNERAKYLMQKYNFKTNNKDK